MGTEIDALKKRLGIANQEVERLSAENNALKNMNEVMSAEKVQWMQQKAMQEQIIQQSLGQSNEKNNSMLRQIEELNAEIRRLREK